MANHHMHPFETLKKIDAPTKLYLIDLLDGFESEDPILTFSTHHMNAREEGEEVGFDMTCNPWDAMAAFMDINTMQHHLESDADNVDFSMKRIRMNVINNDYTGYKNRLKIIL